ASFSSVAPWSPQDQLWLECFFHETIQIAFGWRGRSSPPNNARIVRGRRRLVSPCAAAVQARFV
ncbi:MAG: hypothetical protein ACKVS6_00290, partial [Planctomycetota bacterium]